MTRTRPMFTVPAGTKPTTCRRCRMRVYWITVAGRPRLIDCSVIGGSEPSEAVDPRQQGLFGESEVRDGKGVSHWDDCAPDGSD